MRDAAALNWDESDVPNDEPTEAEIVQFARKYQEARAQAHAAPSSRYVNGKRIVWSPQPGSQVSFLSCPLTEVLYHGNRGPGKTDALLMSFAMFCGKGFGADWRGILFRESYPQLADVVAKSEKWFPQMFPGARFNKAGMFWTWPDGERLYFRHIRAASDYRKYLGHAYPWIGFEELTNWADEECYTVMMSCCRSTNPNMPRMVRATTNPYGPGLTWVRARFKIYGKYWQPKIQLEPKNIKGQVEPARAAIFGHVKENKILLRGDPDYIERIIASAVNEAMAVAWVDGSWDITAGSMFGDVWSPRHNIVSRFEIPPTWQIFRSFDWGFSKPFSVGWWAVSDGTPYVDVHGNEVSTLSQDMFRVHEWYGWTGKANGGLQLLNAEIGRGIAEREREYFGNRYVEAGPADGSIFDANGGVSIADQMAGPFALGEESIPGPTFFSADKRNRKARWQVMRQGLRCAWRVANKLREFPGIYVVEGCEHFIRTIPGAPRNEKDMDDIDTNSEDHVCDESGYAAMYVLKNVPLVGGIFDFGLGPRMIFRND